MYLQLEEEDASPPVTEMPAYTHAARERARMRARESTREKKAREEKKREKSRMRVRASLFWQEKYTLTHTHTNTRFVVLAVEDLRRERDAIPSDLQLEK